MNSHNRRGRGGYRGSAHMSLAHLNLPELSEDTDIVHDEVYTIIQDVQELKHLNEIKQRGRNKCHTFNAEDEGQPPDDFRNMALLPTPEDMDVENTPFLRTNKELGGYEDLDEYLDVQFRLFREDFIQPLRNGISEYRRTVDQDNDRRFHKSQDIRVYRNVYIVRTVCSWSGLLHRLKLDVSELKGVNLEECLIYGSLVCLSSDHFTTFFTATVSNSDPKQLQNGYIDVQFEHALEDINCIEADRQFVMVENTAYYEAYRHVLKGLQNVTSLPFEKYIVHCQSSVNPPAYLGDNIAASFDLRPLIDEDMISDDCLRRPGKQYINNINVRNLNSWPDGNLLHLDESQYQALQTALTKEFSIIQGPPGTGKTYVGLKIVKALLHNFKNWEAMGIKNRPMLIVCYTNHALDQFLEGILQYYNGKVVRVGGRISIKELERYSLKFWKDKAKKTDRRFKRLGKLSYIHGKKMKMLHKQIESIGQKIEAADGEILIADELRYAMSYKHYRRLMNHRFETSDNMRRHMPPVMVEWLGIRIGGQLSTALLNQTYVEDVNPDDDEAEECATVQDVRHMAISNRVLDDDESDEGIVVQDVRHMAINNRMRDGDEDELKKIIQESMQLKQRCIAFDISNLDKDELTESRDGFQLSRQSRRKLKRQLLQHLKSKQKMSNSEALRVHDVWTLQISDRWRLYRLWVSLHCQQLKLELTARSQEYKDTCETQKEVILQKDKYVMEDAKIIAMTTTSAARYQAILQEINPRIIVVEEAAEVLEAHIITSLSMGCEQLILIGDHKQLKPNPSVYKLATDYHLDLSMFERMVQNGVHCDCLALQHRMRPEISKIMKPIYPHLQDHPSVNDFENIKGMSTNIYFINHSYPEHRIEESRSHYNLHEAQYLVALADYLLKQGYSHSQITILTPYSGQLSRLKELMPKSRYDGIRVTTVDNFQGEENDIILLSLVRSNQQKNIGFLKIENRVCVALSRAKKGLYVIGNFDIFTSKSTLWNKIIRILKTYWEFGEKLILKCQNHPEEPGIEIRKPAVFQKAPEGDCNKPCGTQLDCGHLCVKACHFTDINHEKYKCTKPCRKVCMKGHPGSKQCFQECGNCQTEMRKKMPLCGHREMLCCYVSVADHTCTRHCSHLLKCGHTCRNICGMEHICTCKKIIKETLSCGHNKNMLCIQKDDVVCPVSCAELLSCGHPCQGTSSRVKYGNGGLLQTQHCTRHCSHLLKCGHTCRNICGMEHICTCKKVITETLSCGHTKNMLCIQKDDASCPVSCDELLSCEHPCQGTSSRVKYGDGGLLQTCKLCDTQHSETESATLKSAYFTKQLKLQFTDSTKETLNPYNRTREEDITKKDMNLQNITTFRTKTDINLQNRTTDSTKTDINLYNRTRDSTNRTTDSTKTDINVYNRTTNSTKTDINLYNRTTDSTKTDINLHNRTTNSTKTDINLYNRTTDSTNRTTNSTKTDINLHNRITDSTKTDINLYNRTTESTKTDINLHNRTTGSTNRTREEEITKKDITPYKRTRENGSTNIKMNLFTRLKSIFFKKVPTTAAIKDDPQTGTVASLKTRPQ